MILKYTSPVLIVKNFAKMKEFYETCLQQKIKEDYGNCIIFESGLALWELKPNYPLTKAIGYTYSENKNHNLEFCFECDDIDTFSTLIENNNIRLLHNICEESWGQRTIRFLDPEDNIIEINESITSFLKRFIADGMTLAEAAKRADMPIDLVNYYLNKD